MAVRLIIYSHVLYVAVADIANGLHIAGNVTYVSGVAGIEASEQMLLLLHSFDFSFIPLFLGIFPLSDQATHKSS